MTLLALCKSLGDETRLRILRCLAASDACVCELCDALDLGQSVVSNHLAKLRAAGAVETRRDGSWIYYSLAKSAEARVRAVVGLWQMEVDASAASALDVERFQTRIDLRVDGKCHRSYGGLSAATIARQPKKKQQGEN
jgi:ArsR family transcriptional regulator